jgi:hypothetical protein
MAKKVEVTTTRLDQFNKMVDLLRTIRTYDVKANVAGLKRTGYSREEALEIIVNTFIGISKHSRGIAEIRQNV